MKHISSISNKILLLVSASIVVAVGMILTMNATLISNYNNDTIKEQAQKGVSALSEKVERFKESSANYVKLAANDQRIAAHINDADTTNLKGIVNSILNSTKTDFALITDKDGKVIKSAGQKSSANNLKDNAIISSALKGQTTTTVESDIVGRFSALTVAPVQNAEGSVEGTIILGYVLDNESIVDELKEIFKTDVTIFQGNTRISTTIKLDGQRQIGTQLSEAVANVVITEGKDYDGEADILGSQFLCSYRPLKNHKNEIIGVLFAGESKEEADRLVNNMFYVSAVAATVTEIILIVGLLIYLRMVLTKPLKKVMRAADEISEGVLDVELDIKSNNEMGMLAATFVRMADKLHNLIGQVSESSDKVAAASKEIAASSFSLSRESVDQAAAVQELSASSLEVLTMTQNNAEHARNASELSERVKDKCNEGNDKMKDLLGAMDGINDSSKKISKIIKVIDDIAFQTNILSLNAAVEAAQAGQYGKGFAVVAENVKQLAQRSAKAAKEITAMIEESVAKSKSGTEMASETASILVEIFDKINEVDAMIAEISSSTTEQTSGISQINTGIERISGILQSYSAMAEESSASSAELSEQADLMKKQVSTFKLRME
jgi:methyl-accepting chemotaxis protein